MRLGIFLCCLPLFLFAQEETDADVPLDKYYLEDQFYAGITYNFVLNMPEGASQRKLSYGLQLGFIKDLPFNSGRNIGMGIGLGLAYNSYYSNIRAKKGDNGITYTIPDIEFNRSLLETYLVEMPLQFRWRNSTPKEYSFWRIYAGVKFGYAFAKRSIFVSDVIEDDFDTSFSNSDINSLQYGLALNVGYHNFNIHFYYSLTGLFKDDVLFDSQKLQLIPLQVGLIFYML